MKRRRAARTAPKKFQGLSAATKAGLQHEVACLGRIVDALADLETWYARRRALRLACAYFMIEPNRLGEASYDAQPS